MHVLIILYISMFNFAGFTLYILIVLLAVDCYKAIERSAHFFAKALLLHCALSLVSHYLPNKKLTKR